MNTLKKALCLIFATLILFSLCACGSSPQSTEEQVRSAVILRGAEESVGVTIGGNEIRNATTTVTNVKQISDTEYLVSGRITMYDIYNTAWNNTFDCTVVKKDTDSGKIWRAGTFEYKNTNWDNDD